MGISRTHLGTWNCDLVQLKNTPVGMFTCGWVCDLDRWSRLTQQTRAFEVLKVNLPIKQRCKPTDILNAAPRRQWPNKSRADRVAPWPGQRAERLRLW